MIYRGKDLEGVSVENGIMREHVFIAVRLRVSPWDSICRGNFRMWFDQAGVKLRVSVFEGEFEPDAEAGGKRGAMDEEMDEETGKI